MHFKLLLVALFLTVLIWSSEANVQYSVKLEGTNDYCDAKRIPTTELHNSQKDLEVVALKGMSEKTLLEKVAVGSSKTTEYTKAIIEVFAELGMSAAKSAVPFLGLMALTLGTLANYKKNKDEELVEQINQAFSKLTTDINKKFENVQGDITQSAQQLERSTLTGELKQMLSLLSECGLEEKFTEECFRNAKRYIESGFHKFAIYYDEVLDGKNLNLRQLQRLENNMDLFSVYVTNLYFPSKFLTQMTSGQGEQSTENNENAEKTKADDLTSTQSRVFKYVNNAEWKIAGSHKTDTARVENKLRKGEVTVEDMKATINYEPEFKDKQSKIYRCEARFDPVFSKKCVATFSVHLSKYRNEGAIKTGDHWKDLCFDDMNRMYEAYSKEISGEVKKGLREMYLTPLVAFMKKFNVKEVEKKIEEKRKKNEKENNKQQDPGR